MCASSYGYFLIYNVSTTVKGIDEEAGTPISIPLKGYLVLNMDDNCDATLDINLILYGKNPAGQKVYTQLNDNGNDYLGYAFGYTQWGYFTIRLEGVDVFDFETGLMGKVKEKDVGLGSDSKKNVASSLKGVICVWDNMLLDTAEYITGTANISMTLNNKYTKTVNDTEPSWTQEQIIEGQLVDGEMTGLKPLLEDKGYVEVVP